MDFTPDEAQTLAEAGIDPQAERLRNQKEKSEMQVFMVCVILQPTEKEVFDSGLTPQIVVQPQAVMAKDEQNAAMKAMKFVPEEMAGKEDRLEVKVLPFRTASRT